MIKCRRVWALEFGKARETNWTTLVLIIFSIAYLNNSVATILTVKQDGSGNFTTIQAGIISAAEGDTVLVWPGTYYENINYQSKSIIVASLFLITEDENYIHSTIIDGSNNGSCVVIINCQGTNTTLCGFTIQHGSGYSILKKGGGIYIDASNINLLGCFIINNIAMSGGGIFGQSCEITLKCTTVKENRALYLAGGILINYSTAIHFDTLDLNSIYLNDGPGGCDFTKSASCPEIKIVLDTGTVQNPDNYFYNSYNSFGYPIFDVTWQINHAKVEQVNSDLFVNPNGNNENSGLTSMDPLQTIAFALKKIVIDTLNPKTIYLSEGIYSPSVNNEIFPVTQRGFVSIKGSNMDNTIVDAEYLYPLYYSFLNKNFTIENIQFKRGLDNQMPFGGYGGVVFTDNDSVQLNKININESKGSLYSALFTVKSVLTLSNSLIQNNIGGYPVAIFNTNEVPKTVQIINSQISHNGPGPTYYEDGRGGAVGFVGSYTYTEATRGRLINVLISNNTFTADSGTIGIGICGLSCSDNAKVDAINTTIADNIVTNPGSSAQVFATGGGEINFYNSIVYGTEDYEIFLGDGQPTSGISTINISNSDVKGGEENIQIWNNIHILNWLDGNIDEYPLWGEPFGYSLLPGSPCINTGVPMFEAGMDFPYIKEECGKYVLYMLDGDTVTLPATDLAGNPRISGGRIDMGAYEWQDTSTGSKNIKYQSKKLKVSVHPNPFTSNVFVNFSTEKEQMVDLQVIDMNGQEIKKIMSGKLPAGNYKLVWNGKDEGGFNVKAGSYIVCLYLDSKLSGYNKMLRI
jgi:hypothetical protein